MFWRGRPHSESATGCCPNQHSGRCQCNRFAKQIVHERHLRTYSCVQNAPPPEIYSPASRAISMRVQLAGKLMASTCR